MQQKLSDYDLGILWSIGSYDGEGRFVFRHKIQYYLDRMQSYFGGTVYLQNRTHKDGDMQYVLKTPVIGLDDLYDMGWTERNADMRDVPTLPCYRDFMRAHVELHSSLDYSTRHHRDGTTSRELRLRIYANLTMASAISRIIADETGVGIKRPQIIHNGKTALVYYQSASEIITIMDYIDDNPKYPDYWLTVDNKLIKPILRG